MSGQTASRAALIVVYATVFIDLLGFGIIIPQLPYYAMAMGATGVWMGALLTAYSAAQLVGAPILGRLSDQHGRRPILMFALLGSALSFTFTGLAGSLIPLLLARALAGLFGGSISTAQAYIADVTPPAERSRYMGLLGASIGMGFVCGPAMGALMVPFGFQAAAFLAAGLAVSNLIFAAFALKESRPAGERVVQVRGVERYQALMRALRRPVVGQVLSAMFLSTFAFVSMETTFALLGKTLFNLQERDFGLILTFVGVVMVVVQGGLVGRLAGRFGEARLAMVGALVMTVALVVIPFVPTLNVGLAAMALLGGGYGLVSPTTTTLLSLASDADSQGGTLGLGQASAALARAVGPLVAGALYDVEVPYPYLLAGAGMLVVASLVGGLSRRAGLEA